jgi:hypothetical protein
MNPKYILSAIATMALTIYAQEKPAAEPGTVPPVARQAPAKSIVVNVNELQQSAFAPIVDQGDKDAVDDTNRLILREDGADKVYDIHAGDRIGIYVEALPGLGFEWSYGIEQEGNLLAFQNRFHYSSLSLRTFVPSRYRYNFVASGKGTAVLTMKYTKARGTVNPGDDVRAVQVSEKTLKYTFRIK